MGKLDSSLDDLIAKNPTKPSFPPRETKSNSSTATATTASGSPRKNSKMKGKGKQGAKRTGSIKGASSSISTKAGATTSKGKKQLAGTKAAKKKTTTGSSTSALTNAKRMLKTTKRGTILKKAAVAALVKKLGAKKKLLAAKFQTKGKGKTGKKGAASTTSGGLVGKKGNKKGEKPSSSTKGGSTRPAKGKGKQQGKKQSSKVEQATTTRPAIKRTLVLKKKPTSTIGKMSALSKKRTLAQKLKRVRATTKKGASKGGKARLAARAAVVKFLKGRKKATLVRKAGATIKKPKGGSAKGGKGKGKSGDGTSGKGDSTKGKKGKSSASTGNKVVLRRNTWYTYTPPSWAKGKEKGSGSKGGYNGGADNWSASYYGTTGKKGSKDKSYGGKSTTSKGNDDYSAYSAFEKGMMKGKPWMKGSSKNGYQEEHNSYNTSYTVDHSGSWKGNKGGQEAWEDDWYNSKGKGKGYSKNHGPYSGKKDGGVVAPYYGKKDGKNGKGDYWYDGKKGGYGKSWYNGGKNHEQPEDFYNYEEEEREEPYVENYRTPRLNMDYEDWNVGFYERKGGFSSGKKGKGKKGNKRGKDHDEHDSWEAGPPRANTRNRSRSRSWNNQNRYNVEQSFNNDEQSYSDNSWEQPEVVDNRVESSSTSRQHPVSRNKNTSSTARRSAGNKINALDVISSHGQVEKKAQTVVYGNKGHLPTTVEKYRGFGKMIQIHNCPTNMSQEELMRAFEEVGDVVTTEIDENANLCWVVFEKSKDAYEAEHQFDGGEINGRTVKIVVM
ncbi:unnamed protein product [Amoebophrya sp. A120]|nr:unnamed protein product [Amoebophrya sp. A120]|eukprot:GSA120T00015738001.1